MGFSTWAGLSEFDQVISGEAKVAPSTTPDSPALRRWDYKEYMRSGMDVDLNQALVSLDPLESGADIKQNDLSSYRH